MPNSHIFVEVVLAAPLFCLPATIPSKPSCGKFWVHADSKVCFVAIYFSMVPRWGMDLVTILAVNLRKARYAKGFTQEELADRAGLSARYVGDIEQAKYAATIRVLGQLAEALRIDPCDLIRRVRRR
jgi:DNA-binding XRE family transcriptional regulator